jgi:hypothetical protein
MVWIEVNLTSDQQFIQAFVLYLVILCQEWTLYLHLLLLTVNVCTQMKHFKFFFQP